MSVYMIISAWAFVGCASYVIMSNFFATPKTRAQFIGDMILSAIFAFIPLALVIIYSVGMIMMKFGIIEWLNEDIK